MLFLHRLKKEHIDSLIRWFEKNSRDLPWRKNPSPYWVWVAEIMSQQTQMTTLVPYFYRFMERFPRIEDLSSASEQEVLSAWTGLGYYSRAKNLHKTAKIIVQAGAFPKKLQDWLELPGIGPYSAAAITSQCFGVREPVWDGNVVRVSSRLAACPKKYEDLLPGTDFRKNILNELREWIQNQNPSFFNQALMELGATVCTKQNPLCERCPLQEGCLAYQKGCVDKFPPLKPRKEVVVLKPRVWVQLRQKKGIYETYLVYREKGLWFSGMWDFPSELGGNREPVTKITRKKADDILLGTIKHNITHHKILLEGRMSLEPTSGKHSKGWFELDDLLSQNPPVPLATTARKVLRLLMKEMATRPLA